MNRKSPSVVAIALITPIFVAGCDPEVGSKAWCEDMKEKPKGDWTVNEATDFAKHCVLSELKSE